MIPELFESFEIKYKKNVNFLILNLKIKWEISISSYNIHFFLLILFYKFYLYGILPYFYFINIL